MASAYKSNTQDHSETLENANRQLLENQTFLYSENQKLQDDVNRLSAQLENLRKSTVNPEIFQALKQEKDHLSILNDTLKYKVKRLKEPPAALSSREIQKEKQEKIELTKSVKELDKIIDKISSHSEKLKIKNPQENDMMETISSLTKRLEDEQRKNIEANEALRKLREDDEKYLLREKISDMKQLLTDLEVENTKLKFESEQLAEDVENYKKELSEAVEEAKEVTKRNYEIEDEKDKLKRIISDLENDNLRLKKEMIEELNEANRAKRVSIDTEIALQHISEAYENKRKEVTKLTNQLEDAEKIIKNFNTQFDRAY